MIPDPAIIDLPAPLYSRLKCALGDEGAYQLLCSLTQEQVDQLVKVAVVNEWIPPMRDIPPQWSIEALR